MSTLVKNKITDLDIKNVYLNSGINWEEFRNKTFYVTGATGVIGSFIIRCLLYANKQAKLNIKIIAAVRNIKAAKEFFKDEKVDTKTLKLYKNDVVNEIKYKGKVDYIIHAASNTASKSFIEKPMETFNVAVRGTENILNFAKEKSVKSVVYLSSMEVYGNIDQPKPLKETDLGNLDLTDVRSSYPMGKRAAETLCYTYAKEYNVPVKIVRLAQVIGANVDYNDTRVYAQFARSIVEKRDIILNTKAATKRSYLYITDAITGILTVLTKGQNGEAYNNNNKDFPSISEIAQDLANKYTSTKVVFNIDEKSPYAPETHWILDNSKLMSLGWEPKVTLQESYDKLISSFYYQSYKPQNIKKCNLKIRNYKNGITYSFTEQLFSIKNSTKYKIIKLVGIDIIKFKLKNYAQEYEHLPINENKIVFSNFNGNDYGCNPKYIVEELIKRKCSYDLVWLVNNKIDKSYFPSQVRLVNISTKEVLREIITAKYIISNVRLCKLIGKGWQKRKGQVYIQTWHGSLGIKKIDADVKGTTFTQRDWCSTAHTDSKYTDYLLSNSRFENDIFKHGLWYDGEIKQTGHPRNDIFFKTSNDLLKIRTKVYENLGIDSSKRTFIYMPSFRDDYRLDCYLLDVKTLKSTLEEKFGGSWTILIRMHPRLKSFSDSLFNFDESIVDASAYPDIQELLVATDIAMTDYSSCIFDFMLSRKPAFIFATDIEQFNTERGFYYPLESTPFPVATDNVELIENIRNFDYEKYKQEVEAFLEEKGCMEDGHASERVVDLIEKIIKE